uniref:Otopetrin 3 n=1 Tax=Dicentrarchus labrax TaxID=13489 RepID=A0A8C4GPK7_DICLA
VFRKSLKGTKDSDHQIHEQELDPVVVWVPSGRRLISGLLGLNVILLGAALVAGEAFNPKGLRHQEPQVFMLLLMGFSLVWMLWYLLWARKQPGICPHQDHHAGGITVTLVLMLFAAFSLLLSICRTGYLISMSECKSTAEVISPFIEAPFLTLQTYLLWAHSKDCVHRHKIITRCITLHTSLTFYEYISYLIKDDCHVYLQVYLIRQHNASCCCRPEISNSTFCQCSASAACLTFRKGFEILYPFNMEYYLMAGCMIYVMWKNVGRRMSPGHQHATQKLTLQIVYHGGIIYGLVFGALVLLAGVTVFILYQVWVSRPELRFTAFLIFYGYHLAIMPVMSLCSLVGMLVYRLERRANEGGHNPTRSLDVILLVAAALGQLALSYFSLVAALAVGTNGPLGELDLSYSLLSLLELILQNIFIIEGLHRHPNLLAKKKEKQRSSIFKVNALYLYLSECFLNRSHDEKKPWTTRAIKEICAFLILSNVMLWVIPAFGVHPQFENGLGKQFFGFSVWFVLVNLGQPLSVFYRMHSVGALMELLISA